MQFDCDSSRKVIRDHFNFLVYSIHVPRVEGRNYSKIENDYNIEPESTKKPDIEIRLRVAMARSSNNTQSAKPWRPSLAHHTQPVRTPQKLINMKSDT